MRVGVDMFYAQHPIAFHGIGNYSFPMLTHLAHHPKIELFFFQPIYSTLSREEYAARLHRFITENNLDIFHFPSPMQVPFPDVVMSSTLPDIKYTAMVHDLIPSVYPDIYLHAEHLLTHYNQQMAMLHKMNHLLTNCEYTMSDLIRFGYDQNRISIIGFGCDESHFPMPDTHIYDLKDRFPIEQPYVLAFTPEDFRKNPDRIIEAFGLAAKDIDSAYQLVFVGGIQDSHKKFLGGIAERSGVAGRVHFSGRLSKSQLLRLYNKAHGVAIPSLYEGIGLPALEGMQCGIPVLTSNTSALPNVVGDAAIQVDPTDAESISTGLKKLMTDEPLRAQLKAKGLQKVKSYNWNDVADRTIEAFENMLYERGRILMSNPSDESIAQLRKEMDQLREEWAGFKQGMQQDIAAIRSEWDGYRGGAAKPRKARKAGKKSKLTKGKKRPAASKKKSAGLRRTAKKSRQRAKKAG